MITMLFKRKLSKPSAARLSKSKISSSCASSLENFYLFVAVLLISLSCVCQITLASMMMAAANDETNRPTYLEAKVGSYVVFNCPVDFPQDILIPYSLHWSKDNEKIFSWYDGDLSAAIKYIGRLNLVDLNEGYGRASVNLTSIRESDQGWYECKVTFPNRSPPQRNNGTWFYLSVEGGSLIKIPPINHTIREGETANFNCVMKNVSTSHVGWYKDQQPLSELHDLFRRSYITHEGSLRIEPTMMGDLGEYECIVTNDDGETQSARAFLNIQYKAKVIFAPPEVYLPYGQPAMLDCHYRSNPPLKSLRWEKDGFLFDAYNVQGVFYKKNGSLYFSKVDENHAGRYTCTPFNDLGTDGPSPLITVIVQRSPVFTITPKTIYIYKLGDNAQMACDAKDEDTSTRPIVTWTRKDGTPLPAGRYTLDDGNITIESIKESDRGIYTCSATNRAATITADTELMIENVAPRPPYNLTANSSETSITLRWQPGYIRPNLEYIVWYRLTTASEWRTTKILSENQIEATIQNLEPDRQYEFMVLSQDQFGDGMFSKQFRYSTKSKEYREQEIIHREQEEDEEKLRHHYQDRIMPFSQISPPRNFTVESIGDDFLLTWDPPNYGGETLRLYIVRWWLEPEHYLHGTAETRDTHYIVRHLKEDEIYTIQVFTLSITDYESGSNEVEILVPSHRKMRAIAIGATVGLIFLITAVSVFLYVRKSCLRQIKTNSGEKIGP